jgi:hypothetical protein
MTPSATRTSTARPDYGPPARSDDDILEEIRERRTTATLAWADIREEGHKDVMCVAGDVWEAMDPGGLEQRRKAVRPAIAPDEIGQYLNQVGNDVRQNKRSIRATPIGNGADEKTADYRQARIRQIEYRSNAQRDVYSPIFEDALQRSYGFGRVVAKRARDTSRSYELLLEAFPNPDVVLVDPDGAMLSPDCAKIQYAFVLDASWTRKRFKREFPNAEIVDFTDFHANIAPEWIRGDNLTLAEYWAIETSRQRVVFFKDAPDRGFFVKDIPGAVDESKVDFEQWVDVPHVCQYLTNGVELLAKKGAKKRTMWPGKSIPIFSCFGKAIYVQNGAGTQRRLLSMVRHMRQPVMYYSYVRTCQAEVIGSVPRATWVGYVGQFRGQENDWAKANHEPVPFLQAQPLTEATGNQVLPLPERNNWDPPLQNLEMAAEAARRSIQAAAGTSPLPTEAQRVNQKSGKALDRIESSGQKGSYHYVDHLDGMITRVGVLLDELIPHYDDARGEVTIRKPDDQSAQQAINDPDNPDAVMVTPDQQHDITISVGPYAADEREASSEFADTIISNAQLATTAGPEKYNQLTALAIRLKAVGPIGDEMADIISPKPTEDGQPPTPEQVQAMQAQMQQAQQQAQEAVQAVQTDQAKQQASIETARIKAESDARIAQMRVESEERIAMAQLDAKAATEAAANETKLAVAELGAKIERIALFLEERARLGVQDHEAEMAEAEHQRGLEASDMAHAQGLESAEAQAGLSAEQAEAQRAHEAEMAAQQGAGQ